MQRSYTIEPVFHLRSQLTICTPLVTLIGIDTNVTAKSKYLFRKLKMEHNNNFRFFNPLNAPCTIEYKVLYIQVVSKRWDILLTA